MPPVLVIEPREVCRGDTGRVHPYQCGADGGIGGYGGMDPLGNQHLIAGRVDTEGGQLLQAEGGAPFAGEHDGERALLNHGRGPLIEMSDATMSGFGFFISTVVNQLDAAVYI